MRIYRERTFELKNKELPAWDKIHTIIFDFDGIFTNNKVLVSEKGIESVQCDRSDGLGLNMLNKFKIKNNWVLECLIVSTEKNSVVKQRAKKLKLNCYQGVENKLNFIYEKFKDKKTQDLNGVIYLGNDLNDLAIIKEVFFSVAPSDSHEIIKKNVDLVIDKKGGNAFVRTFIEKLIKINELSEKEIIDILE